mmetsp:Transcript_33017/g.106806  ORF Transcript_33017/g.106806 Transcript_33017/m.106806 type:complete len:224 (+) Transcript_33017:2311-2982(+)
MQLEVDRGRQQQVLDELVVDLQVRQRHLELLVCELIVGLHAREHVVQRRHHHTRLVNGAEHRVGFAGTCGAVRKHGRVEPVQHSAHQPVRRLLVHVVLPHLLVEDLVEGIPLLPLPVLVQLGVVPWIQHDDHLPVQDLDAVVIASLLLLLPHGPQPHGHEHGHCQGRLHPARLRVEARQLPLRVVVLPEVARLHFAWRQLQLILVLRHLGGLARARLGWTGRA